MPRSQEYIYVIGSQAIRSVKIGRSNAPSKRVVKFQTGCPVLLHVFWQHPGDQLLERALHKEFRPFRTHGEWFDFGADDPVEKIAEAVARLDPTLESTRERRRMTADQRRKMRVNRLLVAMDNDSLADPTI